jgi:hypothetical protein
MNYHNGVTGDGLLPPGWDLRPTHMPPQRRPWEATFRRSLRSLMSLQLPETGRRRPHARTVTRT